MSACESFGVNSFNKHANMLSRVNFTPRPDLANKSLFLFNTPVHSVPSLGGIREVNQGPNSNCFNKGSLQYSPCSAGGCMFLPRYL